MEGRNGGEGFRHVNEPLARLKQDRTNVWKGDGRLAFGRRASERGEDRSFSFLPLFSIGGDDAMRENGMVLCSHNQTTLKEREKECREFGRGEVERGEATTRASSPQFRALPKDPAWRTMRPRKLDTMYCEEKADSSSHQGSGDL